MKNIGLGAIAGQDHRWPILRALLIVSIVGGTGFIAVNLMRGTYAIAVVELTMVLYALVLLVIARPGRHLDRLILAYILPFLTAMLAVFVLASERSSQTVFIWVLLIPILSHLLLGRRRGLWLALLFLAASGVIYFAKALDSGHGVDIVDVLNIGICSLLVVLFSNIYERSRSRIEETLLHQATTDLLTGLVNRRGFLEAFRRELARCRRHEQPLSLLLIDLDHFKVVNDRYGHEAGDAVLVALADLMRTRLRKGDLPARFGGEEFIVLLPETDIEQARVVAEQLCDGLRETRIAYDDQTISITMSIGVAQAGDESADSVISRADKRLYAAKNAGRDQVVADGVS